MKEKLCLFFTENKLNSRKNIHFNKPDYSQISSFLKSLICLILFLFLSIPAYSISHKTINLDFVNNLAKNLAKGKYSPEDYKLPVKAAALTRTQYNQIKFQKDKQLWDAKDMIFRLNLYPLGAVYSFPVKINEFKNNYLQDFRYSPELYDFGSIKKAMNNISAYAGFKLLCQLNKKNDYVPFADFLGGSTLKALGRKNFPGAYTEGISINPNIPEVKSEYAYFKEFWIGQPEPKASTVTVYALLDSPSVTGAYEFQLTPEAVTTIKVKSIIYLRNSVKLLGLSPILSSFYYGENSKNIFKYNHPEVHSSDGLIISTAETQTWQPLVNPDKERITLFPVKNIKYFGLLQRDRNYSNYLNPGTPYQLEPNVWVTPNNHWGSGTVYLIESPIKTEIFDSNIKVIWIPDTGIKPGTPYKFDYTINWSMNQPEQKLGAVQSTSLKTNPLNDKQTNFIIYFSGTKLDKMDAVANIKAATTISSNAIIVGDPQIFKDPYNNQWCVVLTVEQAKKSVPLLPLYNLTCKLTEKNKTLTETWSYRWRP